MAERIRHRLYFAVIVIVLLLSIGTFYYAHAEKWSVVDSFYFSMMTLTTIGYGDLAPTTDVSKVFTSLYALFGIGVMLYILITVIGGFIFRQERLFNRLFFPIKDMKDHEKIIKKQEKEIKDHQKRIKTQEKEINKIKDKIKKTKKKQ